MVFFDDDQMHSKLDIEYMDGQYYMYIHTYMGGTQRLLKASTKSTRLYAVDKKILYGWLYILKNQVSQFFDHQGKEKESVHRPTMDV